MLLWYFEGYLLWMTWTQSVVSYLYMWELYNGFHFLHSLSWVIIGRGALFLSGAHLFLPGARFDSAVRCLLESLVLQKSRWAGNLWWGNLMQLWMTGLEAREADLSWVQPKSKSSTIPICNQQVVASIGFSTSHFRLAQDCLATQSIRFYELSNFCNKTVPTHL